MPNTMRRTAEARFWAKVNKDGPRSKRVAGRCWLWIGNKGSNGYGRFWLDGRSIAAHRFAFGPVPAAQELDHLCQRVACVRRSHLEPVKHLENVRRGTGHGKETHCPRRHPYSGGNLRVYRGRRFCRRCNSQRLAALRKQGV